MNSLLFLRNSGIWLAAALLLPGAYASDGGSARIAITNAERAVVAARAQNALWTSAEDTLRLAQRAMDGGDTAAALEYARLAGEQVQLGLAQKQYPLTR